VLACDIKAGWQVELKMYFFALGEGNAINEGFDGLRTGVRFFPHNGGGGLCRPWG
jgi:hypothetical protein